MRRASVALLKSLVILLCANVSNDGKPDHGVSNDTVLPQPSCGSRVHHVVDDNPTIPRRSGQYVISLKG